MILISLMLAASPAPAVKPDDANARKADRTRLARPATRSKRMVELEAVIRSLSSPAPETARTAGPEGL